MISLAKEIMLWEYNKEEENNKWRVMMLEEVEGKLKVRIRMETGNSKNTIKIEA
jgi:hypothetical protein